MIPKLVIRLTGHSLNMSDAQFVDACGTELQPDAVAYAIARVISTQLTDILRRVRESGCFQIGAPLQMECTLEELAERAKLSSTHETRFLAGILRTFIDNAAKLD